MAKDHKARLIHTMAALLREQGFHSTGISQVLHDSGTPRGSLYFYFPGGKEELACAAMDHAAQAWRERIERALTEATSAAHGVRALCRILAEELAGSGFRWGSPLATVALETASSSERVREACARHYASWQELIQHRLHAAGVDRAAAETRAVVIVSAIEGALVLCRASRSTAPLDRVAAALEELLAAG